jgi:hypothetical protein
VATKAGNEKPSRQPGFKVGDRVSVRIALRSVPGILVEDRGFIGYRGRRLWRVEVEFDPPNVTYIELPEEELTPLQ